MQAEVSELFAAVQPIGGHLHVSAAQLLQMLRLLGNDAAGAVTPVPLVGDPQQLIERALGHGVASGDEQRRDHFRVPGLQPDSNEVARFASARGRSVGAVLNSDSIQAVRSIGIPLRISTMVASRASMSEHLAAITPGAHGEAYGTGIRAREVDSPG